MAAAPARPSCCCSSRRPRSGPQQRQGRVAPARRRPSEAAPLAEPRGPGAGLSGRAVAGARAEETGRWVPLARTARLADHCPARRLRASRTYPGHSPHSPPTPDFRARAQVRAPEEEGAGGGIGRVGWGLAKEKAQTRRSFSSSRGPRSCSSTLRAPWTARPPRRLAAAAAGAAASRARARGARSAGEGP